jgi:hypothetical protein
MDDAEKEALERQCSSYTFQELIKDIPLSEDGSDTNVRISCVELWGL